MAQSLVRGVIPAVIAMQFKITDNAAIMFAEKFYMALAADKTAEDSLSFARKEIYNADNPTEWGTPVLFSQSEDGLLFQIDRPSDEQVRKAQIERFSAKPRWPSSTRSGAQAIEALQKIVDREGTAHG